MGGESGDVKSLPKATFHSWQELGRDVFSGWSALHVKLLAALMDKLFPMLFGVVS